MDAIDALLARDQEPGIGHNRPPSLAQELVGETESLAERALMAEICADDRCEVIDAESAQKAVLLLGQMKELIEEIETARVARKSPFLRDCRVVDLHFNMILTPLAGSDHKKKLGGAAGSVLARIDAYRRKQDAEIEAERRRLEIEAKHQQEEAERTAAVLQQGGISQEAFDNADLARRRAEDAAATLAARAVATIARPIDSGFGPKTSTRKNYTVTIDDLDAAVKHCMALDAPGLTAYIVQVYQKQVRAGVRALPGARIVENTNTTIRRK